jgi:3-oxoadipate enol-lactonase
MLGRDALALLDALAIARAHLCGLSLGGMVALWVAIHHPERVERAVFANTAARIGMPTLWAERILAVHEGKMGAVRDAVVSRFLSAPFRARHPEVTCWIGDMLTATSPQGYIAACAAPRDADLRAVVAGIQAPSYVVAGRLDEATPLAQAKELQALITGSGLLILDEAAHLSNVEQAAMFNASVVAFLGRS